jgi:hypothetical protein
MRTALLFAIAIAGCQYPELPKLSGDAQGSGGDGGNGDGMTADAMPDAQHICYVPAMIQMLSLGSMAQPAMSQWFQVPTTGPNAGKTTFTLGGQLGQQAPITVIGVEVAKSGNFQTNQAYPFSTNADPNVAFTARAYLYGDYDMSSSTSKQYLYASNGSITFTAIGETAGSMITGSMSLTDFREVNETTGAVIAGGCTTQLAGMVFYLTEGN